MQPGTSQTPTSRFSVKRIAIILVIGAGLCLLVFFGKSFFMPKEEKAPELPQLKIGGTSVAYVIVENRWRNEFLKAKKVNVNYESTGSTKGLTNLIDKKYAISFTHAPLSEEQKKKAGGPLLQIPVVLCAVVPVYHIKELTAKDKDGKDFPPLNFTGEVLARIFLGDSVPDGITKWNDEALKKLNPELASVLPDKKIVVVHRKDLSGTTLIFTDYLQEVSPKWKGKVCAAGTDVKWPVGEGKDRSEGVAKYVKETDGAIGYVDLMHAWNFELPYAAVENKDKKSIHVKAENMTAALKGRVSEIPEDLTYSLANKPGPDTYPICGTVWAVCYQAQPEATRQQVVDFLTWVTHEGQKDAENMSYAPLPDELVKRAEDKIKSITAAK